MGLRHSTLKARRRGRRPGAHGRLCKYVFVGVPFSGNIGGCQLHKCATTFLKNKYGDYVQLSKRGGLKLITTCAQDGAIAFNLEIWKWNSYIAFCFKYGASEIYVVTEHDNELKLTPLQQTTENAMMKTIQALKPWFRMVKVGNNYSIQATKSAKYLTIDKTYRTPHITLSDTQTMDSTFTTFSCRCNKKGCPGV